MIVVSPEVLAYMRMLPRLLVAAAAVGAFVAPRGKLRQYLAQPAKTDAAATPLSPSRGVCGGGAGSATYSSDFGYTYSVTFVGEHVAGNVPQLKYKGMALTGEAGIGASAVSFATVTPGRQMTGSFVVTYNDAASNPRGAHGSKSSVDIPYDVCAMKGETNWNGVICPDGHSMAEKLENMLNIFSTVAVTRTGPSAVGGFVWVITFQKNDGNMAQVTTDMTKLVGYQLASEAISPGPFTCVPATTTEGAFIGDDLLASEGNYATTRTNKFKLAFESATTTAFISWDAPASKADAATAGRVGQSMEEILETQAAFGDVAVTRTKYTPTGENSWSGGYTWMVTFLTLPGNLAKITAADGDKSLARSEEHTSELQSP